MTSRLQTAAAWLADTLAAGPQRVAELQAAAAAAGFAWRTCERARVALGAAATKAAMRGGWVWALPAPPKAAKSELAAIGGAMEAELAARNGVRRDTLPATDNCPELAAGETRDIIAERLGGEDEGRQVTQAATQTTAQAATQAATQTARQGGDGAPLDYLPAGALVTVRERLCLTAAGDRVVSEGDPLAAFLYAAAGDEVPGAEARALGLTADGLLPRPGGPRRAAGAFGGGTVAGAASAPP